MKITVCGSMQFHKKMREVKTKLEKAGHRVYVPRSIELMDTCGYRVPSDEKERIKHKIAHDFIRGHFRKIDQSDAIVVLNYDKKGVKNYVGGNTFLEMGYAFGLGKKIYLMNSVPDMNYSVEIHAMQPVILNGDFGKIR